MSPSFTHAGRQALRHAIRQTGYYDKAFRRPGKAQVFNSLPVHELCRVAREARIDFMQFAKPNFISNPAPTGGDQFDLDRAVAGEPIMTEHGLPAKLVGVFPEEREGSANYVLVLVASRALWYREDGFYNIGEDRLRLRMAPKVTTMWVNLYPPDDHGKALVHYYATREMADRMAHPERIKCLEVEVPRS